MNFSYAIDPTRGYRRGSLTGRGTCYIGRQQKKTVKKQIK